MYLSLSTLLNGVVSAHYAVIRLSASTCLAGGVLLVGNLPKPSSAAQLQRVYAATQRSSVPAASTQTTCMIPSNRMR
jgi:hypothetical protein